MNINTMSTKASAFASKGISGLGSGMDTDSMVEKMLSGTQAKIDKQNQAKQRLTWKQTAYHELIAKITSFQSKYFSSTSTSNILTSGAFNKMRSTVTGSALSVLAGSSAKVGDTKVQVGQLATKSKVESGKAAGGKLEGSLSVSGVSNFDQAFERTLVIEKCNAEGKPVDVNGNVAVKDSDGNWINAPETVSVTYDKTDSDADIASKINVALGGWGDASINADGKLEIIATQGNQVRFSTESTEMGLKSLGVSAGSGTSGTDRKLTTKINTAAKVSLEVRVNGTGYNIELDEDDLRGKSDADRATAMASQINAKIGGNRGLNVVANGDKLEFNPTDAGQKIQLGGSKAALNLIGQVSGASNKVNTDLSLDQLGVQSDANGDVAFTINGKALTFKKTDTLSKVISAINRDADIGAKVSYNSFQDSFTFESNNTGKGNTITMSDSAGSNLLSTLLGVSDTTDPAVKITEGQNAVVNINGEWTERAENTFTVDGLTMTVKETTSALEKDASGNFIKKDANGVTTDTYQYDSATNKYSHTTYDSNGNPVLDAQQYSLAEVAKDTVTLDPTKEVKITAERDTDTLVESIKGFVEDYNALIGQINELTGQKPVYKDYPPLTDAQKKDMSDKEIEAWEKKSMTGLLRQDDALMSFTGSMRSVMYEKPEGNRFAMYDIGIETGKSIKDGGKLHLDENKLLEAIGMDPEAVTRLFTDVNEGLSTKLSKVLNDTVGIVGSSSAGTLVELAGRDESSSTNAIFKQMSTVDGILENLKKRYETEKSRYWRQFNAMEQAVQQMNSQSAFLSQQFGG